MALFDKFHDGCPVRKVTISITNLEDKTSMQLSLFDHNKLRNRTLTVMDDPRNRYGSRAILRVVRGNIKWTAMILPEHIAELRNWMDKEHYVKCPELSDWDLQSIQERL